MARPHPLRRLCSLLLWVALSQACSGDGVGPKSLPNDSTPSHPIVRVGDTIAGKGTFIWRLENPTGRTLNIFFQVTKDGLYDTLKLTPGVIYYARYSTAGRSIQAFRPLPGGLAGFDLETFASGRFLVPLSDPYHLSVTARPSTEYLVWIYGVDLGPEQVPSRLQSLDSVIGESIDHTGDLDTYTFDGELGKQYMLFFSAPDAPVGTELYFDAPALNNNTGNVVEHLTTWRDSTLLNHASGRISPDSSATYEVFVTGRRTSGQGADRGPYRLMLYEIDVDPETASPTFSTNDSILDEEIDIMGDIDRFIVNVADSTRTYLVFEPTPGLGALRASVQDPDWRPGAEPRAPPPLDVAAAQSERWLEPGRDYGLFVWGGSWSDGYVGPYGLKLYEIDTLPELLQKSVAVGDTVEGEELDPQGDIDVFELDGELGEDLRVYVQGQSGSGESIYLTVDCPSGGALVLTSSPMNSPTLTSRRTARFFLWEAGTYRLKISRLDNPPVLGPYRFLVEAVDRAPESSSQSIAIGDSVGGEALDFSGDLDEFTLTGVPGSSFVVIVSAPALPFTPALRVLNAATREELGPGSVKGSSGLVTMPLGGEVAVRAEGWEGPLCEGGAYHFGGDSPNVGGYALWSIAAGFGPEMLSANIAVGDTVTGEALEPRGDIDEFRFVGDSGRVLQARLAASGMWEYPIVLDIIDPTDSTMLVRLIPGGNGDLSDFVSSPFTIPRTDVYIARVHGGHGEFEGTSGWGGYLLLLEEVP